jgi:hypothetical protein
MCKQIESSTAIFMVRVTKLSTFAIKVYESASRIEDLYAF